MPDREKMLEETLEKIEAIIFAKGLELGSAEYFEVRNLCLLRRHYPKPESKEKADGHNP